ncbi:hypothetical protein COO60DRAFT_1119417 [Scenedesmus sp. NREL 46B-D3]|nr:hypothetical protein COO60DRAFT_1119417 [Scenedesmus sp. NREL 46B-D3]
MQGVTCDACCLQGGVNLAQWLVNEPDVAEHELQSYSKGFVKFWRDQRAEYWKEVAQAEKEFDEQQGSSKGLDHSDEHFSQPPMRQVAKAGYADKAFVGEVVKYGEMVQAVYDTLETKDVFSRFFGGCMAGAMREGSTLGDNNRKFINVGEAAAKYKIVKQIEADSGAYKLVIKEGRNYVGFIAEGPAGTSQPGDDSVVDLAVVFRGTITQDEWLQDAKVLQVRWNKGSATKQSPRIFLRALPFQPTGGAFTGALGLSLLLLWGLDAATGSLPAGVAAVNHWVSSLLSPAAGSAPGFLQGLIISAASFLQELLGVRINADTGPLPFSLALATGVWLVNGFARARTAHPNHWLRDIRTLVMAVVPWTVYGLRLTADTLVSSLAGFKGDPLVSYGFKQMYADAKDNADGDSQLLPASPRLTILLTLTELLQQYSQQGKDGKMVRSIHVTGHSLGGALASLCAYDLSTAGAEAVAAEQDPLASDEFKAVESETGLRSKTAAQRIRFMSAVWRIKQQRGFQAVPVVAGITFAAPRVGNAAYANAFKARSLIDPLTVAEPLFDSSYNGSLLGQLGAVFRDRIWLLLKHIWYTVGLDDTAMDLARRAAEQKKDNAAAPVMGGMLRVVNVHDVVPDLPSAVRVPFFRYVHGGQELLLNSLHVPYYRAGQFTGAAIGARHNLEQYLHTLDPTRDQALVNKSDDVLLSSYRVPSNWWSPRPNRGMVCATVGGKGVWVRKEVLDDMPQQQGQ